MTLRDRIIDLRRVPVDELRANPKNWRRHPPAQAKALRAMIDDVGFADALIARETPEGLMLIDGHLRLSQSGPADVLPVLVLDVDEAEADRLLATLDPLAAMAEVDAGALEALLAEVSIPSADLMQFLAPNGKAGKTDPDAVPPVLEQPVTKPGDLWVLGDHRLLCGDATDPEAQARLLTAPDQLLVTDPPYGVNYSELVDGRGLLLVGRDPVRHGRPPTLLGHQGRQPVAGRPGAPPVVAGPGHAGLPAGSGHAHDRGPFDDVAPPLVDDVGRAHGGCLLSMVGPKERIHHLTPPTWEVQPQPVNRTL
jgi:hypothetical protein